jgi:hypothetical protein
LSSERQRIEETVDKRFPLQSRALRFGERKRRLKDDKDSILLYDRLRVVRDGRRDEDDEADDELEGIGKGGVFKLLADRSRMRRFGARAKKQIALLPPFTVEGEPIIK